MDLPQNGVIKAIDADNETVINNNEENIHLNNGCQNNSKHTKIIALQWVFSKAEYFPKLYALCFATAIIPTMVIAILKGDVGPYMPFISEAACKPPSSTIFIIFMNLSAFLYGIDVILVHLCIGTYIPKTDSSNKWCNRMLLVAGLTSAAGMSVVASYPVSVNYISHAIGAVVLFIFGPIAAILFAWLSYNLSPGFCRNEEYRFRIVIAIFGVISTIILMITAIVGFSKYKSPQKHLVAWAADKTPESEGFYFLVTCAGCQYLITLISGILHLSMVAQLKKLSWRFELTFSLNELGNSESSSTKKTHGWTTLRTEYLPKGIIAFLGLACIPTYTIAIARGDITIFMPFISEAGADPPQSLIYSTFFIILSTLIVPTVLMELIFHALCAKHKGLPVWFCNIIISSGTISAFGFVTISLFNMRSYFALHLLGTVMAYQFSLVCPFLFSWLQYSYLDPHPAILSMRKYRLSLFAVSLLVGSFALFCSPVGLIKFGQWTEDHWTGNKTPKDGGFYLLCISGIAQFISSIIIVLYYSSLAQAFKKIDARFRLKIICNKDKAD